MSWTPQNDGLDAVASLATGSPLCESWQAIAAICGTQLRSALDTVASLATGFPLCESWQGIAAIGRRQPKRALDVVVPMAAMDLCASWRATAVRC